MRPLVYLYFSTPPIEAVPAMFEIIVAAGVNVSHFGRNDPPKKWSGDIQAMVRITLDQPEENKYVFIRDSKREINLTVELFYDRRWSHSTISLDGPSLDQVEALAEKLVNRLNPYLCIQGTSGAGKGQVWHLMYERADCPQSIKNAAHVA